MKKNILFSLFLVIISYLSDAQTQIGTDIGNQENYMSGNPVCISSDGNVLAIGNTFDSTNGTYAGLVRVYKNTSGVWTQIGNDITGQAANDYFGNSISLSSDGSIIAIGAKNNDGNGEDSGQVRVYKNTAGVWTQIGSDIVGEVPGDFWGYVVSLSADGNIIAVGSPYKNNFTGQVRIYKNNTGVWTQLGDSIFGEQSNSNRIGESISLSSDGNTLAIGSSSNSTNGDSAGQVRIYKNIAGVWSQLGAKINGEVPGDNFGTAVSLSSEGNLIAIGAPQYTSVGATYHGIGKVIVYENTNGVWTQMGNDIEGKMDGEQLGYYISLSGNGNTIAIGSPHYNGVSVTEGKVRIYHHKDGLWTQIGNDINGKESGELLGMSVSLSASGNILAVGAPYDTGTTYGQVRVYDLSATLATDTFVLGNSTIYPNPATNQLFVNLQNDLNLQEINIYSTLGELLKTEKTNPIDVSYLSTGLYLVKITTNRGEETHKIIIE